MSIRPSLKGDKINVEADSKDAGLTFESAMAQESGRNRVYAEFMGQMFQQARENEKDVTC